MRSAMAAAASALLWTGTAQAQRVQLDISGANFQPVPMAFPEVRGTGDRSSAKEIDSALQQDLLATGLFNLLDRKSFLGADKEGMTANSIIFQHWLDVGADGLLKGAAVIDGGEVKAEFRLFTVATSKEELKLNLSAPLDNPRRIAHQVANAVFKFYTHEPGPFETKMVYVRKTGATSKDVCVSDWDGHRERCITKGGANRLNLLPAWSPDGTKIAYTSYKSGFPDLYLYDFGTDSSRPIVQRQTLVTGVAFSPDGRHLAWAASEGEGSQIWVSDIDGGNAHKVTEGYGINSSPAWSPDSQKICFVSNRAGSPQLYVIPAGGGAPTRLTFQGNYNQTPDWSPRGDLIAFTARDERQVFDLFTIAIDGGKVTRLTQDQGQNEEPTFAPNGRLIAFTSDRGGKSDLWVMTVDGSKQYQLTKGAQISTPAWGPLLKQ